MPTLINWIMIYTVDSGIQPLNNWGQVNYYLIGSAVGLFVTLIYSLVIYLNITLELISENLIFLVLHILKDNTYKWEFKMRGGKKLFSRARDFF